MSGSTAAAGAVGGRAARACDSCLRRRARWYCAADDAFLCQACDASVHSANRLARRHDRVRLRPTTSSPAPHKPSIEEEAVDAPPTSSGSKRRRVAPAWSKRKARTRRPHVKSVQQLLSRKLVVVPEVAAESSSDERRAEDQDGLEGEEEEQLLYRVPSFDRALAELCSPPSVDDAAAAAASCSRDNADGANKDPAGTISSPVQQLPDSLAGFGAPTDAEIREFAADMEALLGQGLDESFYMESLGLMTPPPAEDGERVKMEPHGSISNSEGVLGFGGHAKPNSVASAEVLDMDFNRCSPTAVDEDHDDDSFEQKAAASNGEDAGNAQFPRRSLDLRLNYEAVIESWGSSPWTDGQRPHVVHLDDFWPHHAYHSGMWPAAGGRPGGEPSLVPRRGADGGREARVSRYREKRRTRLFAKKIRYEVRKLNAEKRPRMKGRFVKRPPAAGGGAPCAVT